MDLNSLIGWILGFGMMVVGIILNKNGDTGQYEILMKNFANFVDPTSIAIVIGGVAAALMISFPMKVFGQIPKHLKIVFFPTKYDARKSIAELVEFAQEARVNGLLALEDKLNNTKD
ncbi:MAG: motility protein A, partial [Oscillospiraceae bacterium]